MNRRNKFYLLVCIAMCVFLTHAMWAQTPVVIKFYGTDGSDTTTHLLTLAVHPNGTNDSPCVADSISPTLKESSQGLPPPPQGFDLRVIPYAGFDCLSNYTSIHKLYFDTQTDVWKIQFQRDGSQTGVDFQWPSGLADSGAGSWKIVGDPNDADGVVSTLDVDMTLTTMLHLNLGDTDPHTFYIRKGDGAKMRTFTPDDIANAVDSKGKSGKAEKRKNYHNDFCFFFQNTTGDSVTAKLHVEYKQNVQVLSSSGWTVAGDGTKKQDYTRAEAMLNGESMEICGIGDKGKPNAVSKWYWVGPDGKPLNKVKYKNLTGGHSIYSSRLWLKMPNVNNIGEECYAQNVWTETYKAKPAGIVIGVQDQVDQTAKLKPIYRFVYHPKWKDVTKTLSDKTGKHTGPAGCLLNFQNAKPILKGVKSLPPGKLSNVLIAQAVALAFNIGASDAGKFENPGFSDMVYVNQAGDPAGLPEGTTVREIDAMMDSVMSCATTRTGTFAEWDSVLTRINSAFSGPFDTVSFGQSIPISKTGGGTVATGVRPVADVNFLYRTSMAAAAPVNIQPLDLSKLEAPKTYQLEQNYPNPFNPTTTIQFSLPEDAMVSVTVYNMLGQAVATLADNEEFTEGLNDVTFDASRLASGVYFYRIVAHGIDDNGNLSTNAFISVKKMMLVK